MSHPDSPRLVARFAANSTGRDLIVGDIHGCFSKLQAALDAAGFNPDAGDRLFSVGDLVDRGPESELCLEWLSKPWFHAILGNHEEFAIQWVKGDLPARLYDQNGGQWNTGSPPSVSRAYADAFSALPLVIEVETDAGKIGLVHATCPWNDWRHFIDVLEERAACKAREDVIKEMLWSRDRITAMDDSQVEGVRAVVVGHTPMERHTTLGNVHFIDTGAWRRGGAVGEFTLLNAATLMPEKARRRSAEPAIY